MEGEKVASDPQVFNNVNAKLGCPYSRRVRVSISFDEAPTVVFWHMHQVRYNARRGVHYKN